MYDDITGIILSGGKSTRMGENKSLLKIGDRTVIEYVNDLMKSIFSKVILITNNPDEYEFLNLEMHDDIFYQMGPLAGIHSGLIHSKKVKNFIISCDIPLMTSQMIAYLVEYNTNKPITIAKADGFIQQLCGLYDQSCLGNVEKLLFDQKKFEVEGKGTKNKKCNVLSLIDIVGAEIIDAESLSIYKKDIFFNMNKRSDFEIVLQKLTHQN
jgi:molybdopterin-guanine dinucleotide biosynthesis protein A